MRVHLVGKWASRSEEEVFFLHQHLTRKSWYYCYRQRCLLRRRWCSWWTLQIIITVISWLVWYHRIGAWSSTYHIIILTFFCHWWGLRWGRRRGQRWGKSAKKREKRKKGVEFIICFVSYYARSRRGPGGLDTRKTHNAANINDEYWVFVWAVIAVVACVGLWCDQAWPPSYRPFSATAITNQNYVHLQLHPGRIYHLYTCTFLSVGASTHATSSWFIGKKNIFHWWVVDNEIISADDTSCGGSGNQRLIVMDSPGTRAYLQNESNYRRRCVYVFFWTATQTALIYSECGDWLVVVHFWVQLPTLYVWEKYKWREVWIPSFIMSCDEYCTIITAGKYPTWHYSSQYHWSFRSIWLAVVIIISPKCLKQCQDDVTQDNIFKIDCINSN